MCHQSSPLTLCFPLFIVSFCLCSINSFSHIPSKAASRLCESVHPAAPSACAGFSPPLPFKLGQHLLFSKPGPSVISSINFFPTAHAQPLSPTHPVWTFLQIWPSSSTKLTHSTAAVTITYHPSLHCWFLKWGPLKPIPVLSTYEMHNKCLCANRVNEWAHKNYFFDDALLLEEHVDLRRKKKKSLYTVPLFPSVHHTDSVFPSWNQTNQTRGCSGAFQRWLPVFVLWLGELTSPLMVPCRQLCHRLAGFQPVCAESPGRPHDRLLAAQRGVPAACWRPVQDRGGWHCRKPFPGQPWRLLLLCKWGSYLATLPAMEIALGRSWVDFRLYPHMWRKGQPSTESC